MSTMSLTHPAAGVSWTRVEDGFYVGNRRGNYLGYIDQIGGDYSAVDAQSRTLGIYPTLVAAMAALTSADQPVILTQLA